MSRIMEKQDLAPGFGYLLMMKIF